MKKIIVLSVLAAGISAQAQTVTLNPGDTNNLGVTLSCTPAGSSSPVNPPAPVTPPAPTPVLVGIIRALPNMDCLGRTPKSDPKTVDDYITNCGFNYDSNISFCDSTSVVGTQLDNQCYSLLYSKEASPTVIHSDQMQDLRNACTITTYNCYKNE